MFSPFRLLMLAVLAFGVYMGFYAVPAAGPGPAAFDPAVVARHETAAWQAGRQRQDWPAFISSTLYQRELHRLSWFRAAQSGFALSRVLVQIPHMTTRYDRLLPNLEEIARVERDWRNLDFDAQWVARKQLNWLSFARNPRPAQGDGERVISEMSEELGARFGLRPDQTYGAAQGRAQALILVLAREDPDWDFVTGLLQGGYESLRSMLDRAAALPY